jgi:hypothetical protein
MRSAVRFAVAWLAVWCQVIVVAMMPAGMLAARLDPLGEVPICHAEADGGRPQPAPPTHAGHDCLACIICQSHGQSIALLSPTLTLPQDDVVVIAPFAAAQPRAPPPVATIAAQPRGPPSLI